MKSSRNGRGNYAPREGGVDVEINEEEKEKVVEEEEQRRKDDVASPS